MLLSKDAKERLTAWWEHQDMDRPCFAICRQDAPADDLFTEDVSSYWTDVDGILKRNMWKIDHTTSYCEDVKAHYIDFGSTPLGACLGGELNLVDRRTTWNVPFLSEVDEVTDLTLQPDNKWWKLIRQVTERSAASACGHHYVTYTSLAGILDILSALMGLEPTLYALIDSPDEVLQAENHLLNIWEQVFRELGQIIDRSQNDGYVGGWPGIWSPGRSYPIQEDMTYMLSVEMFEKFGLPYIDAMAQMMDDPYYHLDGKGAIKCVDSLCGLSKLKVVQWMPGTGNEELSQWHDLIKHILSLGKSVHVYARPDEVAPLIKAVGSKGVLVGVMFENDQEISRFLDEYKLNPEDIPAV